MCSMTAARPDSTRTYRTFRASVPMAAFDGIFVALTWSSQAGSVLLWTGEVRMRAFPHTFHPP